MIIYFSKYIYIMLEGIKKKISIPSFSYKHMIILIVVIIFIIAAKYTYNLFVDLEIAGCILNRILTS